MRKLAWFSGGFAAACLWACYGGLGPGPALSAAGLAALSLALWLFARPRAGERSLWLRRERPLRGRRGLYQLARRALALCLGAALALAWSGAYFALFRAPAERFTGENVPLAGEVRAFPGSTSIGGCAVTLRLEGGPDALVYAGEDWAGLGPGDRVRFTARRAVRSDRPYGDETTYYTAKGVYLIAYCSDAPETVKAERVPLRYWPALCAEKLKAGIRAAFDDTAAPIAAAVTLGDKSGLDGRLYSALSRAGLMHAAVVSGLHISFLVGAALAVFGNRRGTALGLLPLLLFYALMAGGTPSALRAVIMQSALLAAPLLRRENDAPSSLGLALLVLLVQNPFAAASVSLQLSFASVAGILLATPALSRRMFRAMRGARERLQARPWGRWLWKAVAFALGEAAVSLGAMLFTVPLIALYFGQIPLISPLSGVLTLWALSGLMACALVLGTAAVFLPGPAAVLGLAAGLLGHYARGAALLLGKLPFASLSAENGYCLVWLGTAYLVLLAGLSAREGFRRPAVPALALGLLLCAAVGLGRLEADTAELTVTALDVGQGACTAFLSGGRTALVDCGGSGARDPGDTAADYFAAMGRTRLDLLALTHFDADHWGGVEQLFYRMDVACVAIPGGDADPADVQRLRALAGAEGAEVLVVDRTRTFRFGRGTMTLFPPLLGGTTNEAGLFALCSVEGFDALVTGDADAYVEKMLVKYCPIPDVELLLAGHHGSRHSTCGELLEAARPELAIVSVGRNSYDHPAPEVLERLEDAGARVLRTDEAGSVTVTLRDGKVRIS